MSLCCDRRHTILRFIVKEKIRHDLALYFDISNRQSAKLCIFFSLNYITVNDVSSVATERHMRSKDLLLNHPMNVSFSRAVTNLIFELVKIELCPPPASWTTPPWPCETPGAPPLVGVRARFRVSLRNRGRQTSFKVAVFIEYVAI